MIWPFVTDLAADFANKHCRAPGDAYPRLVRLLECVARHVRDETISDMEQAAADAVFQRLQDHRAAVVTDLMTKMFEANN